VAPTLSILIVTWNAEDDLRRCLTSLRAQDDRDFQIVVVDNGSNDGSVALVQRTAPGACLIETGCNLGFAAACNRGLAACTGAWVLTLNNDTEAAPDLVRRLREAATTAPDDIGMFQARIVLRGRARLNSTGVLVHADGSAHDRDFDAPLGVRTEADEIFCVTAGAGLYRRAMLEPTRLPSGFFDPAYYMYFEDVDLGWRCRLAGWRASYVPGAQVVHAFQGSSRRRGRHFVTVHCMRNRVRTLLKNASWRMIVRSLPRTASDLLWLLQHAGGRALADWLGAAGSGLRQRRRVRRLVRVGRRAIEQRWVRPRVRTG